MANRFSPSRAFIAVSDAMQTCGLFVITPLRRQYSRIGEPLQRTFPGWRLDVAVSILMALIALTINSVFLGVAVLHSKPGSNGLGILHQGSCKSVNWWNQVCHAVINVASTLLVQQSNSCMQKLSSPTREEIDRAHSKRQWVEIGIQSFRNVWQHSIDPWRVAVWWMLAVSSTILHLLWNSVILSSPTSYEYVQLAVTERFLTDPNSFNAANDMQSMLYAETEYALYPDNLDILRAGLNDTNLWEQLNTTQCIDEYARGFVRGRSDVVTVVTSGSKRAIVGAASGGWGESPCSYTDGCMGVQRVGHILPGDFGTGQVLILVILCISDTILGCAEPALRAPDTWALTYADTDYPVSFCYSRIMGESCSLDYGYIITVLVICSLIVKLLCFLVSYWLLASTENKATTEDSTGEIILTPGDAIASFLRKEDLSTSGMCLADQEYFEKDLWSVRWFDVFTDQKPMPWTSRSTKAWFRAVGLGKWASLMGLMLVIPLASGIFLWTQTKKFNSLALTSKSIWDFGLGSPMTQFLMGKFSFGSWQHKGAIVRNVFFANLPQLLLSIAQFWCTSQLTCMLTAREYDKFAAPPDDGSEKSRLETGRRLRVTNPMPGTEQRIERIPKRYRLLNLAIFISLPWLASQAVFFAKIEVLDHWLYPSIWSISQVGYSVLGLIIFTIVSFLAFLTTLGLSLRRLENRIPLAGTCSAAISAACHPTNPNEHHPERRVLWGVDSTYPSTFVTSDGRRVECRRCTFTSDEVSYPVEGQLYA